MRELKQGVVCVALAREEREINEVWYFLEKTKQENWRERVWWELLKRFGRRFKARVLRGSGI